MVKDNKKALLRRLKIIEGQIRGLHTMVEDGEYCIDVITQTSAVKSALSSLEDALLEDHLSCCVIEQIHNGKEKKAVEEILNIYRLKRK
jgi:DNA-binding FrmR family transcriptional regulator